MAHLVMPGDFNEIDMTKSLYLSIFHLFALSDVLFISTFELSIDHLKKLKVNMLLV